MKYVAVSGENDTSLCELFWQKLRFRSDGLIIDFSFNCTFFDYYIGMTIQPLPPLSRKKDHSIFCIYAHGSIAKPIILVASL